MTPPTTTTTTTTGPLARSLPLLMLALVASVFSGGVIAAGGTANSGSWIDIPAGMYRPLLPGKDEAKLQPVAAFKLSRRPVVNGEFAAFVHASSKWRRDRVKALFASEGYLKHWPTPEGPDKKDRGAAVVNVSFFAAQAFCEWRGGRLPTTAEWEYVGASSATARNGRDDPAYNQKILDWYARPNTETPKLVERTAPNFFGVHDMHGLVWEWTSDFNSVLVTGESRGDSSLERELFCGSGSVGAADPSDYAAFMRTAFRSSLDGRYVGGGLGFRCAMDAGATATGAKR